MAFGGRESLPYLVQRGTNIVQRIKHSGCVNQRKWGFLLDVLCRCNCKLALTKPIFTKNNYLNQVVDMFLVTFCKHTGSWFHSDLFRNLSPKWTCSLKSEIHREKFTKIPP